MLTEPLIKNDIILLDEAISSVDESKNKRGYC